MLSGLRHLRAALPRTEIPMTVKLTCEEFLAVEESFKPKMVYWAAGYSKGGKPEAAMIDVEGT